MSESKLNVKTLIAAIVISVLLSVSVSYMIIPSGTGELGSQGPIGETGPPGPKGEKGDTGPKGEPYPGFELEYDFINGQWNEIATWTGSASRTTELFSVPSLQIRITWDVDAGPISVFVIYLYEQGDTYPTDSWVDVSTQPQGETMAYINPGAYYLDFDVINCDYTVTVEVYVPP